MKSHCCLLACTCYPHLHFPASKTRWILRSSLGSDSTIPLNGTHQWFLSVPSHLGNTVSLWDTWTWSWMTLWGRNLSSALRIITYIRSFLDELGFLEVMESSYLTWAALCACLFTLFLPFPSFSQAHPVSVCFMLNEKSSFLPWFGR